MKRYEIKEYMDNLETCINDFTLGFNPCVICGRYDEEKGYGVTCRKCCWYHASQFKLNKGRKE